MPGFTKLTSRVVDLPMDNVDTDQIIPARFLKVTDKSGLGEGLFAEWRRDPDFVLNRPQSDGAQILLAGDNFGCGSSREHAPWALYEHGFRAVLSTRFADIFRNNSLKNGLLVVPIDAATYGRLRAALAAEPDLELTIDLAAERVSWAGGEVEFSIDPFARHCLLEGVDQLGYLLEQVPAIERWESEHPARVQTAT